MIELSNLEESAELASQVRDCAEWRAREGRPREARLMGEAAAEIELLAAELAVARDTVRRLAARVRETEGGGK